jgi:predicted anti-sigma-YlaC factor YlaD
VDALPGLDCDQVVELVTHYLDGALDGETARRVEEHLALCDGCDLYVEQIRQTVRALGHVPVQTLPPEAQATLTAAFRDFHANHVQRREP